MPTITGSDWHPYLEWGRLPPDDSKQCQNKTRKPYHLVAPTIKNLAMKG